MGVNLATQDGDKNSPDQATINVSDLISLNIVIGLVNCLVN